MSDRELRDTTPSGRLDFEEQINDLRSQIKTKKFWISLARWALALIITTVAVLAILAAIFGGGFGIAAIMVGMCAFSGIVLIEHYSQAKDEKSVLEARLRRLRVAAIDAGTEHVDLREIRLAYRASLPDLIENYRLQARKLRRAHNSSQVVIIVGSLSATALISLAKAFPWANYIAILNTLVIGSSATISSYFKFKERSLSTQNAADSLEGALRAAELNLAPYDNGSADEILARLVGASERIRSEHRSRERELDQISDVTYPPLNENLGTHQNLGSR